MPELESNLGPIGAEYALKPGYNTQNKARQTINLVCSSLVRDQGVGGLNPLAPTILQHRSLGCARDFACGLGRPQAGSSSNPLAPTILGLSWHGLSTFCAARRTASVTLAARKTSLNVWLAIVMDRFGPQGIAARSPWSTWSSLRRVGKPSREKNPPRAGWDASS